MIDEGPISGKSAGYRLFRLLNEIFFTINLDKKYRCGLKKACEMLVGISGLKKLVLFPLSEH